jgi:hypothetical protein
VTSSYTDFEKGYVKRGFVILWTHVPSGNKVLFKGMITQFSDKFNPEWNSEKTYGRNDPIANFKGTSRQIAIGWSVVAASQEEAKSNLAKVSLLTTFLYPTYSTGIAETSTISAAPLMRLWFSNLVASVGKDDKGLGLVGYIEGGFGVDHDLDEGFFDLSSGILYPKHIKLSCTFSVLHTHKLGWGTDKQIRQGEFPYGVSLAAGGYSTKQQQNSVQNSKMDDHKKAQEQKITQGKK